MKLIFYLLIIFSLVGLAVIISRKIPRLACLSKEEIAFLERKKGLIQKSREINHHQQMANLITYLEKFLRRAKIWSLKTENLLSYWIKKLREKSWMTTQKSREKLEKLIEEKRIKAKIWSRSSKTEEASIPVKVEKKEENNQISIADLEKPIKEEQELIDLIIQNPKNVMAYKSLGMLYWKQHNYPDAKASLEMAIKLGSKDKKVKEVLEELKKLGVK
jgi:tetratricopeptide (TPR) repeat protein